MKWRQRASRENVIDLRGNFGASTEEDRQIIARLKDQISPIEIADFVETTGWPYNWEPINDAEGGRAALIRRRNPDNSWTIVPAPDFSFSSTHGEYAPEEVGPRVPPAYRSPRRFD